MVDGKAVKRYDIPKTPYQRLLESPFIPAPVKHALKEQFDALNPFRLRKTIDQKLKAIFAVCYPKKL